MANATATYKIVLQDRTKRAFKAIGRSLNSIRKSIFSMKTAFISAAGIAGIGFFVKKSMDATDEMAKMSRAVGVSVEELQSLRHAAALGGLEATQLDKAVQKLAINMADMSRGVGLAKDVFEKHNISVANADGSLRSVMEVMDDVADVTAGMTNQTEKADLAYKLFGARGAKMINMLNGGSEAMREAMAEAERLGLVMSSETAKGVEDANDAITRLKAFLTSAFTRTVAELAPLIETLTEKFIDFISIKVDENGGVGAIARSMANQIVLASISILRSLESMANGMIDWKNKIAETFGFKNEVDQLKDDINDAEMALSAYIMGSPFDIANFKDRMNVYRLMGKDFLAMVNVFDDAETSRMDNQRMMFQGIEAMKKKYEELIASGAKSTTQISFSNTIFDLEQLLVLFAEFDETVKKTATSMNELKEETENTLKPTVWEQMKEGFESYFNSVKNGSLSLATITEGALKSAEDAIVNMMMGVKTNWKSLFKAILADLIRLQLRKALVGAFGGFFANGGRPPVGRPSIVGERGAELFVPDSAGTIIPNHELGGSSQHTTAEINFNVQAIDAASFNTYLVNNRDTIESVINNSLLTNGSVRRTIQMVG
nr:Phage-related minor tail protein [uncultured Mediterranean phage uvMED]